MQVPYRTAFSMETVGNEPSLRFEVRRAGAILYYPVAEGETPPTVNGITYDKVSYRLPPDPYTAVNVPYVDFLKDYVNNPANPRLVKPFVHDDFNWVNIISACWAPLRRPPTNRGHYHTNLSEFWFIPEGKVDFLIEGRKLFTAEAGDVVYAPPGRWHRASSAAWPDGDAARDHRAPAQHAQLRAPTPARRNKAETTTTGERLMKSLTALFSSPPYSAAAWPMPKRRPATSRNISRMTKSPSLSRPIRPASIRKSCCRAPAGW